jgi:myo-inositol 2-dehydrogenase / D-chiro-inositol 1-dehydrogenase
MKRIGVVGAGAMARVRTRALLATGKVEVVAVASRRLARAEAFGAEVGCSQCFDDYQRVTDMRPDAVLVEVPHAVQDEVVLWAIDAGLHVLIGGVLATREAVGEQIRDRADRAGLVVEAGFQARYAAPWTTAHEHLRQGRLGRVVAVRSVALWAGDPATWYYDQQASAGMPLTHMTYCFINPIRWIMGDPRFVSAFANRIAHTDPGLVEQETCVANLLFDGDVLCSLTAGYVKGGDRPVSSVTFLGTDATLEVLPSEEAGGSTVACRGSDTQRTVFDGAPNAFQAQADAFLAAIDGANTCRNTPAQTIGDLRVAEAIVASAAEKRTVVL